MTRRSVPALALLAVPWLLLSCDGSTPPPVFPDLVIVTDALPPATEGEAYQATVHAEGGDGANQWSVASGQLPPGLTLTQGGGGEAVLSGQPTAAGDYSFAVRVESGDGQSTTRSFTLAVGFTALAIVTETVPPAEQRQPYEATVHATGGDGTYQWTVTSGGLPPGVTLTTGAEGEAVLSGTPEVAGEFSFSLRVESGDGQTASRTYAIPVEPGHDALVIVTEALPAAAEGQPYSATVTAAGGGGSYQWDVTAGNLPAGLSLSVGEAGQAVISGTPTMPGDYGFTLTVQSADGQSASREYVIQVGEDFPDLVIDTASLPAARLGDTYSEAVHASGGDGAYDWDLTSGALPPGLALSVDDLGEGDQAIISGVPEEEGDFTFTLTVTSGDGQSASRAFTLTVRPAAPVVMETPALVPALAGGPYDVRLRASGGDGQNYQWSLVDGTLPAGLALTQGGRIHGTPTTPDTATFIVEVHSAGQTARREFTLVVVPHTPDEFNITIFPVAEIPAGVLPHVRAAVAEWERAITADLSAITIPTGHFQPSECGGFGALTNGTSLDDVLIIVSIEPIDGPGGVLGRAGPCAVRTGNLLPAVGVLILDSDDLAPLVGNETLTYIISHEIAHVLGFGTIWQGLGLIQDAGGTNPIFVGVQAVQEYANLGGTGGVPVENQGGAGTRDGHWRQTVFRNERLTGFSAPPGVFQPLSRVSIASFRDKGYTVDMSVAHSFTLSAALRGDHHWHDLGYDEILDEPVTILPPASIPLGQGNQSPETP